MRIIFIKKYRFFFILFLSFLSLFNTSKGQTNAEQVLTIGRNVLSMEDYMLAIQYFNQAIKAKPYLADPYFFRAIAKLNLDDYEGAEDDCTRAIERNKFKTEAYKVRGFSRQLMGKDSLAVTDYDIGLQYNPIDKYFLFYKGIALTDLKNFEGADSTFALLLQQYPKFDEAYTARARLNLEKNDTVAALEDIEKSLSISKSQINSYLMKAEIEWKRKNWNAAGEAIDGAIRLRPELSDLYVNRAFIRYNSDDFYGAMSDYNYALELDNDNAAALFNRALLRYEVKDLIGAEKDLSTVISYDPGNFHALFNRGLIRLELDKNKEALEDFAQISDKYPRFYPVYYAMAEAKKNMGDLRAAGQLARRGEELVELYIKDPDRNPMDRPTIAAAESNTATRSNDNTLESETEVMERFNRLVTVTHIADAQLSYNEKIKGKVQDRDVNVKPEPSYALSFAPPAVTLQSVSNYFRELDDLNQMNLTGYKLYLTPGLQTSTFADMMTELFDLESSLSQTIKKGKGRPVDYLSLGIVQTMLKNYPEALENLDMAIAAQPRSSVALMARGYAGYANALADEQIGIEAGDEGKSMLERQAYSSLLNDALKDFDGALAINPRLVYAWFNKGNILYEAGDFNEARKCYDEAIKLDPDFGQAYFNRGLTYLQSGNKGFAFTDLSKAGELGVLPSYNILKRMK